MPIFKRLIYIHYVQSLADVLKIAEFTLHSIYNTYIMNIIKMDETSLILV